MLLMLQTSKLKFSASSILHLCFSVHGEIVLQVSATNCHKNRRKSPFDGRDNIRGPGY